MSIKDEMFAPFENPFVFVPFPEMVKFVEKTNKAKDLTKIPDGNKEKLRFLCEITDWNTKIYNETEKGTMHYYDDRGMRVTIKEHF